MHGQIIIVQLKHKKVKQSCIFALEFLKQRIKKGMFSNQKNRNKNVWIIQEEIREREITGAV